MEELQIFEGNTEESTLELLFWDEELSDEQKAAYEVQAKNVERLKKLRMALQEKKKSNSCEFWRKRKAKIVSSTSVNNNTIQRIQIPNNNNNTYSLVVGSSASQSMITGRLVNSTVSNLQARMQPQIKTIRNSQPLTSTIPPSVAQPMSVIHRNSLQQPLQNAQIRATSVLPMQYLQNALFDASSGLLIVPSSQGTQATQQQIAVRTPLVRQSTPVSTFITRPTTASAIVSSRIATPNQMTNNIQVNQQAFNQTTKKTLPSATPTSQRTTTVNSSSKISLGPRPVPGMISQPFNNAVKSTAHRQPPPSTNGPTQQNPIHINKVVNKTPVVNNKVAASQDTEVTTMVNGNSDTNNNTDNNSATGNAKTFPSLVVNVKPCLHEKPSKVEASNARTELDQKVKQILMYVPSKFTEWLMQQGLLRVDHHCHIHKTEENLPSKFELGIFNDKDNLPSSGGLVWISDCCPGRQISVFEGSIFESPNHTPSTLLKLMYHWACQTSAANVLNWCKVSGSYLKNFYTLLRSVCVAALHEFCPKMGGPGKFIEVGIITLGTTLSAPSGKKHVKIEILGVFDPSSKIIRMKLVNPSNATNASEGSKNRGVQILSPISLWVEKSSTVVIDSSIEQNLLLDMGFKHIVRCQSNAENETASGITPTNVNVMKYLRHVVPKMFQATLCVLSKSLIQQFLDELSWRERWGRTSKDTFDNILDHIIVMTKWEFGSEKNLVAWLNKVSLNPFQDWSYTRQHTIRTGIDLLPDSIRKPDMPSLQLYERSSKVNSNGISLNNLNRSGGASKPPLLLPQVPMLVSNNSNNKRKHPEQPNNLGGVNLAEYFVKHQKTIVLESYYYAELPGIIKQSTGEFPQLVKCPLCSKPFYSNLDVYRHIFSHVNAIGRAPSPLHFCNYCLKEFQPSAMGTHVQEHHKMTKIDGFACRICTEKFTHESQFVMHMWENHCAADTPYKCEICDYQSSFHHQVIDHYNEQHKGCDSVLCPICMKVLPAKSHICLKQITVHIQTHQMRKGKKCPHCVLVFFGDGEYRAHILEGGHKERTNQSRKTVYFTPEEKGLMMAKPPKIVRAALPPPLNKKPKVSADGPKKYMSMPRPVSSVSSSYNIHEHSLTYHGVQEKHCIECDVLITRPEHYPGHMSCIKCRFSTCCKTAMDTHHTVAHPPNSSASAGKSFPSIKVNEMPMMDKPLLCACDFQTINPNRLARHLALCDKTTAFPLDWEEQKKKRAGLPPPAPLSILDHLGLMRNKSGE